MNKHIKWVTAICFTVICFTLLWKPSSQSTTFLGNDSDGLKAVEPQRTTSATPAPAATSTNQADASADDQDLDEPSAEARRSYQRYTELAHKTLMTQNEKNQYHELLANPELAQLAAHSLTTGLSQTFSQSGERARLKAVDFLMRASKHPDQNVTQDVAGLISMIIKENTIEPNMDERQKRSLTGDKVELYRILLHYAPSYARAVAKSAATPNERELYAFAIATDRYSQTKGEPNVH